jgi:Zn-dependent protease with chaperone function
MFVIRCIGVSLACFVLAYSMLSVAVAYGWKFARRVCGEISPRREADLLCVLRMLPLVISAAVTLAYTVPSFLLLEPNSTNEPFGPALPVLGLCCLGLLGAGIFRGAVAQLKTSQALSSWLNGATVMESGAAVPVFRTGKNAPSLTVAGVCAPRVLISETAVAILTGQELRTALRHELAHVRRHDNLKKLLFRFSVFPGMARLEYAWSEAAEMAADDEAVSSFPDALDLAAALIKLSRFAPVQPSAALTTAFLHPSTGSVSTRVERLFAWRVEAEPAARHRWWYTAPPVLATLLCVVMTYSTALSSMHEVTEWLVR